MPGSRGSSTLGHGERRQHPFQSTRRTFPQPFRACRQDYYFRYNEGMQLHLIGDSLIGWMAWDLMRGVDLLLAWPGIDKERIILLGAVAGGGDPAAVTAAGNSTDRCRCAVQLRRTAAGLQSIPAERRSRFLLVRHAGVGNRRAASAWGRGTASHSGRLSPRWPHAGVMLRLTNFALATNCATRPFHELQTRPRLVRRRRSSCVRSPQARVTASWSSCRTARTAITSDRCTASEDLSDFEELV